MPPKKPYNTRLYGPLTNKTNTNQNTTDSSPKQKKKKTITKQTSETKLLRNPSYLNKPSQPNLHLNTKKETNQQKSANKKTEVEAIRPPHDIGTNTPPIINLKSSKENQSPTGSNQSPLRNNQSPTKINQSSTGSSQSRLRSNRSPSKINQSPTGSNQSTPRSNQSPTKINQSPTGSNQSTPRSNQSPTKANQQHTRNNQSPTEFNQSPTEKDQSSTKVNQLPTEKDQSSTKVNQLPTEKDQSQTRLNPKVKRKVSPRRAESFNNYNKDNIPSYKQISQSAMTKINHNPSQNPQRRQAGSQIKVQQKQQLSRKNSKITNLHPDQNHKHDQTKVKKEQPNNIQNTDEKLFEQPTQEHIATDDDNKLKEKEINELICNMEDGFKKISGILKNDIFKGIDIPSNLLSDNDS